MPFTSVVWARQDAYARLPFDPARATASDLHAGSITFLDLARTDRPSETVASYIDAVPAWLLARPSAVLIRWMEPIKPEDAVEAIKRRLVARGIHVDIGLVCFQLGVAPKIVWNEAATLRSKENGGSQDAELLQRARRVEVASYVHWGGAVWRPVGYHYCFPSGRHSRTYVRLADAFADVRAAPAIATWLYQHVRPGVRTAVIVDSGTLGPIVTELRAAATAEGASIGPVTGIDSYPPSPLGLQQRLRKLTDGLFVLGLVSVSDTGTLATQLAAVLAPSGAEGVVVEQLVSRSIPEATALPSAGSGVLDPWLSLGNPLGDPADPPCEACRDPSSARIVRIDPRSMSAMVLPEPDLLMPDLTEARRNASIWEAYQAAPDAPDAARWIGLVGPTGTRQTPDDAGDTSGVFFEPATLIQKNLLRARSGELKELASRRPNDVDKRLILEARNAVGDGARVVVIDEVERRLLREKADWEAFKEELGPFIAREATFFRFDASGDAELERIEGAEEPKEPNSALVVALGLRTGVTLHRMFLASRQRWPEAQHRGLVIHAHPHDDRIWTSARNTFTDHNGTARLLALWLTYAPRRSPFAEELTLLQSVAKSELHPSVLETFDARRAELESISGPSQPFWGPPTNTLRAGSFLGEGLREAATAAAVGTALHAARLRSRRRGTPSWAQVDLPRTFRSFFDGLIHVSVIRWCTPEECWWGESGNDAIQLISELQRQMEPDWPLLLPELLLATLEGKLPKQAADHVIGLAEHALRQSSGVVDERARRFLALGLELDRVANRA